MVNILKMFLQTFCRKCGKYQSYKVAQYKTPSMPREMVLRRKQSGYGRQTKPIFWKKAKATMKIVLRLDCAEPNCGSKRMLAIKTCKHFELVGDKKRPSDRVPNFVLCFIMKRIKS
ncbi:large ribosomal subunit protein eL42-like [Ochotona princeps]|uniref:large ribosomal subunit protein eL42-like n=1 Tax=Ochotona princeps TaxID=9978 RepID=UPI0027146E58|nr:large ribosomal subunit protein eL42-like [Ochotona princeps]